MGKMEGNKIIAEFMGEKTGTSKRGSLILIHDKPDDDVSHPFSYPQYHTSWDWLMPVVEKINSVNNNEYDVIIWRNDCHINDRTEIIFETSRRKSGELLIEVVWEAVIQFITWYNSLTSTPEGLDNIL